MKTHFISSDGSWGLGDSLEGDESGTLSGIQVLKAGGYEDAIFARERDEISDGAESDKVEERAQVVISSARKGEFAGALEQGVGEFEGEADGAQILEKWPN